MPRQSRPKKLDADGLWNYALRVLGQRAHSTFELRRKLSQRAESPPILDEVIQKLKDYGFSDDQKFSEAFASSRLQNQGFGKLRVLRDLQAKRVSSSVAGTAVEKTFSGTEEQELIDRYLERKYRGKKLRDFLAEEKNLASAFRRLRTAGFSARSALEALKRHASHAPDWEIDTEIEDD